MPDLAFLLAAMRREDVINGEGMSKSKGLERHAHEATILDLELAKSLVAGAMTSQNPCPLPCFHRSKLTCGLTAERDKGGSGRARGRTLPG